jgi:N-acetylglutamate synthase-like GNAT family acetyltransferase
VHESIDPSQIGWQTEDISALDGAVLDEIKELINDANRKRPRIFPGDRMWPDGLRDEHNDHHVILCYFQGRMAGCVLMKEKEGSLWIYLLAVTASLQGMGLGASLLSRAEQRARDQHLESLRLEAVDQGHLVDYYLALGFDVEGRRTMPEGHWKSTEPFVLTTMVKRLTGRP